MIAATTEPYENDLVADRSTCVMCQSLIVVITASPSLYHENDVANKESCAQVEPTVLVVG